MAVLSGLGLVAVFLWSPLASEAVGLLAMPIWKPLASNQENQSTSLTVLHLMRNLQGRLCRLLGPSRNMCFPCEH